MHAVGYSDAIILGQKAPRDRPGIWYQHPASVQEPQRSAAGRHADHPSRISALVALPDQLEAPHFHRGRHLVGRDVWHPNVPFRNVRNHQWNSSRVQRPALPRRQPGQPPSPATAGPRARARSASCRISCSSTPSSTSSPAAAAAVLFTSFTVPPTAQELHQLSYSPDTGCSGTSLPAPIHSRRNRQIRPTSARAGCMHGHQRATAQRVVRCGAETTAPATPPSGYISLHHRRRPPSAAASNASGLAADRAPGAGLVQSLARGNPYQCRAGPGRVDGQRGPHCGV